MIASSLRPYLDDLVRRIDSAQEERLRHAWEGFWQGECETDVFVPPPREPSPPGIPWPDVHINRAIEDFDTMLLGQFRACSDVLEEGAFSILNVRSNYGTGILPSLFGCELYMMPEEMNTLPTALPLHRKDRILALLDRGVPDARSGLGAKVFEAAERYLEIFAAYPDLARDVQLYHPDTQGPIDVAEVVWGSEIFLEFLDDPDLVRSVLELMTRTYIAFLEEWYRLVPRTGEYSAHWGLWMKGHVMLRNDSLMNLSPQIYEDMIRPLDQQCLDALGGAGAVHFCGRGDHFIEAMSHMEGLTAVQLSQPEYNDMETIYRHTVDKGIALLALNSETAHTADRPLRGLVQCGPFEACQ